MASSNTEKVRDIYNSVKCSQLIETLSVYVIHDQDAFIPNALTKKRFLRRYCRVIIFVNPLAINRFITKHELF